jgi:hypothetical protein
VWYDKISAFWRNLVEKVNAFLLLPIDFYPTDVESFFQELLVQFDARVQVGGIPWIVVYVPDHDLLRVGSLQQKEQSLFDCARPFQRMGK